MRFREQLEQLAPDVIFANEAEWEIVGAAYGLAPTAVVKRGARGLLVLGEERVELPARDVEVVDATGAGRCTRGRFSRRWARACTRSRRPLCGQAGAMP